MNLESARRKSGRRAKRKEESLEEKAKEARASAAGGSGMRRCPGAAYPEIVETCYNGWNGLEGEGSQYGYWNGKVAQNYSSNACLKKYRPGYTSATFWWERSVCPTVATYFAGVRGNGGPNNGNDASDTSGVCPCFCLILLKAVSIQCARRRRKNPGEEETL